MMEENEQHASKGKERAVERTPVKTLHEDSNSSVVDEKIDTVVIQEQS